MRGMIGIIDSIDQQIPAGSFSSPVPGNVAGIITLAVSASDYDQVASVQFRVDGVNIGAPDTTLPYATSYDTRALLNGPHTFSALITDRVGNAYTTSVNVTFANAPVVTLTAPANGATVTGNGPAFTASVTHYDATCSTQFKIDGANYGGAWSGAGSFGYGSVDTRAWQNGNHTWSVTATDGHGNVTTASVVVNHNNAPLVSLTSPGNGATLTGNVAFNASVTSYDASVTSQWKVDGVNYGSPISGAAPNIASVDTRGWANGGHTIAVITTDGHGNSASASISVTLANVPVVTITAPGNGATVGGNFAFTATITQYGTSCSTQFKVDGANYGSAQGGSGGLGFGSVDSRSWLNGSHTLSVTAQDAQGNTTTASITVTFNNAPLVSITAPGNGATVSAANTFSASVTSYDASVSTQFKVDGGNVGTAQSGAGSKSVGVESRSYANGWHTYSVAVSDGHGNTANASISVYHRNAPVVAVTSPGNGATYTGYFSFRANITHYSSGVTSRYYIDGGEWNSTGVSGSNVGWDNLDSHYLSVGWHNFRVISTDAEGNTGQSEVNMYVNNQAPAAGWLQWGDLYSWWQGGEDPDGWYVYRTSPPTYEARWNGTLSWGTGYDKTWWSNFGENYGGAGGPVYPVHYMPANPDPTHYQMRLQMYYGRLEGGTDHNHVQVAVVVNGDERVFFDNGATYGQWAGLWNVNGGEGLQIIRWANDPFYNNGFMQDIRAYYDFVFKPGFNS